MAKTVVALFDEYDSAQGAVQELVDHGFRREDISLIASDREGARPEGATGAEVASGAAGGAGIGAVLGGFAGLLVGLGALAIPGIGPVLAAGPLAATLAGAGIGAVTGGLIGALVDAGVPEEEARYYAEGVRQGGVLVTVHAAEDMGNQAEQVLNRFNPVDVHERSANWQPAARAGMDSATREYADTGTTDYFAEYDEDFRNNYRTAYADAGYSFDQYRPAYRYGWDMADSPDYRERDWDALEQDARADWEQRHPDSGWSDYRQAVRYGWERRRMHAPAGDQGPSVPDVETTQGDFGPGRADMAGATMDRSSSEPNTGAQLERGADYPSTNFDEARANRSHHDIGEEGRFGSGVQGTGAGAGVEAGRQGEHLPGSQVEGGLMGTGGRYGSRDPEGPRYDDTRADDDMPLDRGTGWTGASTTGSNRPREDETGAAAGITGSGFTGSDMGQPGSQYRGPEHAGSGGPMRTGSSGGGAGYEEHWTMNYGSSGREYTWYSPAYTYGESIAGDQRYKGRQWDDVELNARRDWETSHPDSAWDEVKAAVRHAWERARR